MDERNSILVTPQGYIYDGGKGIETALESGLPYTDLPYLGSYNYTDTTTPQKDNLAQRAVGRRTIGDTVLNGPLTAAFTPIWNNRHQIVNRMFKAAPEGVANSDNIGLLQLIRLYPEMQAMPVSYFFLEHAFLHREIPHLEFKEDFPDIINGPEYLDRLEQSDFSEVKYDQIAYDLKKLVRKVYTPFEDIWRTIINPAAINYEMIRWSFQRKRNLSALEAIKQVSNASSLEKIEMFDADSPYHSKNHTAKELNNLFNAFIKANALPITTVILNPNTLNEYTENTWTKSGPNDIAPMRVEAGGVFQFPGFAGIEAIVDVEVPDNRIYAINKQTALRLGEGPKILRRYEDNERDAAVIKIVDFHQHLAVNAQISKIDRKFGLTIEIKLA